MKTAKTVSMLSFRLAMAETKRDTKRMGPPRQRMRGMMMKHHKGEKDIEWLKNERHILARFLPRHGKNRVRHS